MEYNTYRSKCVILNAIFSGKSFELKSLSFGNFDTTKCGLYINHSVPETRTINQELSYYGLINDMSELLDLMVILYAKFGARAVHEAMYQVYKDSDKLNLYDFRHRVIEFIKANPQLLNSQEKLVLHEMPTNMADFNSTKMIFVYSKKVPDPHTNEKVKQQLSQKPNV